MIVLIPELNPTGGVIAAEYLLFAIGVIEMLFLVIRGNLVTKNAFPCAFLVD